MLVSVFKRVGYLKNYRVKMLNGHPKKLLTVSTCYLESSTVSIPPRRRAEDTSGLFSGLHSSPSID
jgi:hypothetical protein